MQLIKALPAPLFAALAASAPLAAPQSAADYEQLRQVSQGVQRFADSTSSQFSEVSAQFDSVAGSFSGNTQESFALLLGSLSESVHEIQRTSSEISSALDDATTSYEDAESVAAGFFFKRRRVTATVADGSKWDKLRARDDAAPQSMAGAGTDGVPENDGSIATVSDGASETVKEAAAGSDGNDGGEITGADPTASLPSAGSVTSNEATSDGSSEESVTPEQATGAGVDQSLSPGGTGLDQSVTPEGTGVDQSLSPEGTGVDQSVTPEGTGVDQSLSPGGTGVDQSLSPGGTGVDQSISPEGTGVDQSLSPVPI
ncbi:hypothetical protein BDW66DRAFT_145571 [Aspergillus desertorum]